MDGRLPLAAAVTSGAAGAGQMKFRAVSASNAVDRRNFDNFPIFSQ
jgi:hypothetical protein